MKNNLAVMGFIILSGLAKLGFHRAHVISSKVPESCLLIILGTVTGGALYLDQAQERDTVLPQFTSDLFFFYLLPPIILEASWSLYNPNFFSNLRAILLFAVAGTLLNFLLLGGLLVAVVRAGLVTTTSLTTIQTFLYASLISAVDPVFIY